MSKDRTLREFAGEFLLSFPILDNSIAGLFSSVFGARSNSVEIFYGNISLQNRLDCITAFCEQDFFPFGKEEKEAIESILRNTKEVQRVRNLLAHHFVLDEPVLVAGGHRTSRKPNPDPETLFVWRTNRKGKYEVKPITKKEIAAAIEQLLGASVAISSICADIRMRYGLRP